MSLLSPSLLSLSLCPPSLSHIHTLSLIIQVPEGQVPEACEVSLGFDALAGCVDRTEVSRTFAAMLQLINNRWVGRKRACKRR